MGLGGISIWQLLIVLVIVALIFGTKKLRGIGGDLGGAVKGFKKAMNDEAKAAEEEAGTTESVTAEDADGVDAKVGEQATKKEEA